jgi:hypothetical protein
MSINKVIDEITTNLFEPEKRRIQGWVDKLIRANQEAYDVKEMPGFLYGGVFYRASWLGPGDWPGKKALHHSLYTEMDALLKDREGVYRDRDFIRQTLVKLLQNCDNSEQIRNTLPEGLVAMMPSLSCIRRTDEPACTIRGDARAMRQYEKMLPKIEVYSAARLIY